LSPFLKKSAFFLTQKVQKGVKNMHFAWQNACFLPLFALFGSKKMQNFAGHRPYFLDFGGDGKIPERI